MPQTAATLGAAAGAFSLGAACGAGLLLLLERRGAARRSSGAGASAATPCASSGKPAPVRFVARPHPGWTPGEAQPPPYGAGAPMVSLDPSKMDKASMYAFVISAVVPRPIAFVSSLDAAGIGNLSPYSYFNVMGHNPPTVAIGVCRSPARGGGKKDTLQNIEETGEFVVNLISEWFVEAANHTCGEYDRGVDEMRLAGLTPAASEVVAPPRVAEAAVALECRLRAVHEVADSSGAPTTAIIIGEVVMAHVAEAVAGRSPTGKLIVDPLLLQPVCRLGGVTYGRVTELYDITRPGRDGRYAPPPAAPAGGGGAGGAAGK